jgi:hypothetical protein
MKISSFVIFAAAATISAVSSQPLQHMERRRAVDDSSVETLVARTSETVKVKPLEEDQVTQSGIVIPEKPKHKKRK